VLIQSRMDEILIAGSQLALEQLFEIVDDFDMAFHAGIPCCVHSRVQCSPCVEIRSSKKHNASDGGVVLNCHGSEHQPWRRSKRSRFITLVQAATKSRTKRSAPSA